MALPRPAHPPGRHPGDGRGHGGRGGHRPTLHYPSRIRGEADRMAAMIGQLLSLARLQSESVQLDRTEVDLRDVVSDALASARILAERKGIRVRGAAGETGRGPRRRPRGRARPRQPRGQRRDATRRAAAPSRSISVPSHDDGGHRGHRRLRRHTGRATCRTSSTPAGAVTPGAPPAMTRAPVSASPSRGRSPARTAATSPSPTSPAAAASSSACRPLAPRPPSAAVTTRRPDPDPGHSGAEIAVLIAVSSSAVTPSGRITTFQLSTYSVVYL